MANFRLKDEGRILKKKLKKLSKMNKKLAENTFKDVIFLAAKIAKNLSNRYKVPFKKGEYIEPPKGRKENVRPWKRTGAFWRSIRAKVVGSRLTGSIVAGMDYAPKLEKNYKPLETGALAAIKTFSKRMNRNQRRSHKGK